VKKEKTMTYLVVVSFDINNEGAGDYEHIYKEMKDIGLRDSLADHEGKERELPTSTVAGIFKGSSAKNVRNDICTRVGSAFRNGNIKGKIFISVGRDWMWGVRNTR
jgi:hypothetical protein